MAKLILRIEAQKEGAIKGIQALKAEVQALSQSLSSVKVNKDLTAQINALTRNYTAAIEAQAKLTQNSNKQASGIESTRKGYANLITTLKTLKSQYADGVFGRLPKDAERSFRRIQKISAAFQKNKTLTEGQAKAYANLSQKLKKLSADLATVKAKNDKIVAANPFTVTQAQQIPRLIKQYSTLLSTLKNTERYYPKGTFDTFKADLAQGQVQLQALNQEFLTTGTLSQDSQVKLNALAHSYNQLNASVAQTTSTMKSSKGTLKDIVTGFAKFQLAAMLVMKPLQWIRSALSSINETLVKTEDAVIALQRVLPNGSATDNEISSRLYKVAQDYGQTFENVSQIAQNFARTGMDWADTIRATEAAVLALNVAELNATEASEGLIAVLTQFGKEASDLELVVDELNITADNAAVTTEKLLAALQRTGSSAKNANLTLEQTIGIITALSEATGRSGENLGTAVNSLIQFSTKTSALDTFSKLSEGMKNLVDDYKMGEATILEIWQGLSEEIQNSQTNSQSILGTLFEGEDWRTLNDELQEELGEDFATVTDIYNTASTFRKNYFVALLGNLDTVKDAMQTMEGAEGYSFLENDEYLDTYTAKVNSLKAQWEDFANSAQGILALKKMGVDVASGILTVAEALDKVHILLPLVTVAATAFLTVFKTAKIEKQSAEFNTLAAAIIKNKTAIEGQTSAVNKLKTQQKTKLIDTLADAAATKQLTAEELKRILTEGNLTRTIDKLTKKQKLRIAEDLNAKVQSGQLTQSEAEQIGTALGLTVADGALVVANKAVGISFKALGASIKSFLASVPIIGWILLAVSVITEIANAIAQCCGDAKDERIESVKEVTEEALKLIDALNEATKKLKEANDAVQENIQSLELYKKTLSDTSASVDERADALNNVISISEKMAEEYDIENDYITSLRVGYENLSKEMDRYTESVRKAAAEKSKTDYESAKENLKEAKDQLSVAIDNSIGEGDKDKMKDIKEAFDKAGINDYSQFVTDDTIQIGYSTENLEKLRDWQEKLQSALNDEKNQNGQSTDTYRYLYRAWTQVKNVADDIEETISGVGEQEQDVLRLFASAEILNNDTLSKLYYAAMDTTAEAGDAYDELKRQIKDIASYTDEEREALLRFVNSGLKDYIGKYESHLNKWANDITKVVDKYKDLIEVLKKLKEESKESTEWEEKKLAVLEAQRALEAARNEATVRRFNEATGQWEWQVDEKKVTEAEKNYKTAQQNLSDGAIDRIVELLEDGTATNEGIKEIIDDAVPLLGQAFAEAIVKAFREEVNVDPTQTPKSLFEQAQAYITDKGYKESDRAHWTDDEHFAAIWEKLTGSEREQLKGTYDLDQPVYDNGGAAIGKGLMRKATDETETVNGPDLTAKILSPVSNEHFNRWVHDQGILFETARQYAQMPPVVERVGGAIDNHVDNSRQIIFGGGLTVGADKRSSSIDEVLAIGGIVSNE